MSKRVTEVLVRIREEPSWLDNIDPVAITLQVAALHGLPAEQFASNLSVDVQDATIGFSPEPVGLQVSVDEPLPPGFFDAVVEALRVALEDASGGRTAEVVPTRMI